MGPAAQALEASPKDIEINEGRLRIAGTDRMISFADLAKRANGDAEKLKATETFGATAGTFPTDSPLFGGLVVGVIAILAGLTFFPALALGPIVEQLSH